MSILIESVHKMNEHDDRHYAEVSHRGHRMSAIVVGEFDRLSVLAGRDVTAEYELNSIESVEINLANNDAVSGIFPDSEDTVLVDGSVHLITPIDEHFAYIDVYVQNGADFLSITSDDVGKIPRLHSRIRIRGRGLKVHPSFT